MKSFFKIIFMFFVLTIALLSEPSALQAQPVDLTGSIQNIKTETVVLVSNNILGGDIRANTEEETVTAKIIITKNVIIFFMQYHLYSSGQPDAVNVSVPSTGLCSLCTA